MENNWIVKIANHNDLDRWFKFVTNVTHDFYDIDLVNNANFRNVIIKNINRKTAIYVEHNGKIIGGMTYSPNSNHISWIAVDPRYRRRGIGSKLVKHMFKELSDRKELTVKTFIEGEWQSDVSHPFYRSLGFESTNEISYDDLENNANKPMLKFKKIINNSGNERPNST